MRAVVVGAFISLACGNAMAADYLRGSTFDGPPVAASTGYNWTGFYVGGQYGYTGTDFDPTQATRGLTATMVRALAVENEFHVSELPKLRKADARAGSYGGFIGYNAQWGDVVLGLEGNYSHTDMTISTNDSIGRSMTLSSGLRDDVFLTSNATARLTDYGTIRARAGYAAGWIMPYGFVGLAIGRFDYTRAVSVSIVETDNSTTPPTIGTLNDSQSESKHGAMTIGYTAGAGVDIGLLPGVFLRGEYEFIQLGRVAGISMTINTFRAGAAVKF